MKFNEKINSILEEGLSRFNYKTFKQVEKDLGNLSEIIKLHYKDDYDGDTFKVVIGNEVETNASISKTGKIRGRRNSNKLKPAIKIVYDDSFWKKRKTKEIFFKVKDFNNWLNNNIQ